MTETIKFKLDHLNELDVMELTEELKRVGVDPDSQVAVTEAEIPKGGYGIAAELSIILEIARENAPLIISVFALWFAKGRDKGAGRKTAFSWTKDGLSYEALNYTQEKETDTSSQIKNTFQTTMDAVLNRSGQGGTGP